MPEPLCVEVFVCVTVLLPVLLSDPVGLVVRVCVLVELILMFPL